MINYDTDRGVTVTKDKAGSTMLLKNAVAADSGNYTCMPHNIHPASVLVHVLGEGNSAAQLMSSVEQKMGVVSPDTSLDASGSGRIGNFQHDISNFQIAKQIFGPEINIFFNSVYSYSWIILCIELNGYLREQGTPNFFLIMYIYGLQTINIFNISSKILP